MCCSRDYVTDHAGFTLVPAPDPHVREGLGPGLDLRQLTNYLRKACTRGAFAGKVRYFCTARSTSMGQAQSADTRMKELMDKK